MDDITDEPNLGATRWLAGFITVTKMLEQVTKLAERHFDADPQAPEWADLATLSFVSSQLGNILNHTDVPTPTASPRGARGVMTGPQRRLLGLTVARGNRQGAAD